MSRHVTLPAEIHPCDHIDHDGMRQGPACALYPADRDCSDRDGTVCLGDGTRVVIDLSPLRKDPV